MRIIYWFSLLLPILFQRLTSYSESVKLNHAFETYFVRVISIKHWSQWNKISMQNLSELSLSTKGRHQETLTHQISKWRKSRQRSKTRKISNFDRNCTSQKVDPVENGAYQVPSFAILSRKAHLTRVKKADSEHSWWLSCHAFSKPQEDALKNNSSLRPKHDELRTLTE